MPDWFHLEVDACLDADVCDQACIPLNDSLTCGCYQDYKMSLSTGECKAKGESQIMTEMSFFVCAVSFSRPSKSLRLPCSINSGKLVRLVVLRRFF